MPPGAGCAKKQSKAHRLLDTKKRADLKVSPKSLVASPYHQILIIAILERSSSQSYGISFDPRPYKLILRKVHTKAKSGFLFLFQTAPVPFLLSEGTLPAFQEWSAMLKDINRLPGVALKCIRIFQDASRSLTFIP